MYIESNCCYYNKCGYSCCLHCHLHHHHLCHLHLDICCCCHQQHHCHWRCFSCFILFFRVSIVDHVVPRPLPHDHTHPLYHEKICHMYRDHSVLLKGLDQGKTLTKTVEVKTGLPLEIENLVGALHLPEQDMLVQR